MAHTFGDLSQSEKLSENKQPVVPFQIVKFFQKGTKIEIGGSSGISISCDRFWNVINHFIKRTQKIYHNKFIPFNSGGLVIGLGVRRYVYTVEEYKKGFFSFDKVFLVYLMREIK